jgi:hypothetical protein
VKPCEGFIFDTNRLPLLIITFPARSLNVDDWLYYSNFLEKLFASQKKSHWIIDITEAPVIDPSLIYKSAVWVRENKKNFEHYCMGCSFVFKNSIIRKIARLFLTTLGAGKIMAPVKFFETPTAAVRWAEKYLEENGVTLPALEGKM